MEYKDEIYILYREFANRFYDFKQHPYFEKESSDIKPKK